MKTLITQLIALLTFFGFPALQYFLLVQFSKNHAKPELWYLPDWGFRLVIRNMHSKRTLTNIKQRSFIRSYFHSGKGSSVTSYEDQLINEKESMFLFPKEDYILLEFNLKLHSDGESTEIIVSNSSDNDNSIIVMNDDSDLVIDYEANIKNYLNFNVKVANRVKINETSLFDCLQKIQESNVERTFMIDSIQRVS